MIGNDEDPIFKGLSLADLRTVSRYLRQAVRAGI